jgi:tripartite-type tricarboxylate transporter receptor subunit TctC
MMRKLATVLLILAATAHGHAQAAAAEYPTKPIRLLVPVAPGGGNDLLSRHIAQKLGETSPQRIVVDNRAGAGGVIATELAARAPADGYTLLMGGSAQIAINPQLHRKLPYDTQKDLAPITLIADFPSLVIVHPGLPVQSVKDLIAHAKANPGRVAYGSPGNGSGTHLAVELLKIQAGIDLIHVPYKGAGPALADLVSGQIALLLNNPLSSLPYVRTGRVRAVAVTGAKRLAAAPNIPTVSESGLPGFTATHWLGLLAPARTPPSIISRLHRDVSNAVHQRETVEWFQGQGMEAVGSTPSDFSTRIRADISKWGKVIESAGVRLD